MTEATHADENTESNVLIQVFSKQAVDRRTWTIVKRRFVDVLGGSNANRDEIAERFPDVSEIDEIAGSPQWSSRVMAIQLTIPSEGETQDLTLAKCHELRISPTIRNLESELDVEIVIQPLDLCIQHKIPGLAVFDMDSTLIQQEVIDELARSVGRYEQVAAVTEAAMRGELDFEASLRARVASLKGVPTDIWDKLKAEVITFTPGARELVRFLKGQGWKTAVLSGGFTPLAFWVKDILGLDYAHANQLATDDSTSTLSGELKPGAPIVGAAMKRELLLKLAAENKISVHHTIAVGDGSNDLLMMGAAGLGIAFNAKPEGARSSTGETKQLEPAGCCVHPRIHQG